MKLQYAWVVMEREVLRQVSARGVMKRHGRRLALRGIDLTFHAGTVTGITGPNGAGKSTLLAILSTLMAPTRGKIAFDDRIVEAGDASADVRSMIGHLAHSCGLYGDLGAAENLAFFARLAGVREEDVEGRVGAALAAVDLAGVRDRRVKHCSRGMVQRLALARLHVASPRLWLMDEPTTGLDVESRAALVRIIAERREGGDILVVVSHDDVFLGDVSDRIVRIVGGRIAEERPA